MEAALFIYLASLTGNFSDSLEAFIAVASFAIIAACFWYIASHDVYSCDFMPGETKQDAQARRRKPAIRLLKMSFGSFVALVMLWVIVPTERTMYLMAGAYLGQQALTSEVSKDLQDIVALQVKKYKNELQEQVK